MMTLAREAFAIATPKSESRAQRFQVFFNQHQGRVYALALRFCGDAAAAEDIAQAVFVKIYDKLHTFRGDAEATTWLYRIVHNSCLDHHRRAGVRRRLAAAQPGTWTDGHQDEAATPELEMQQAQRRARVHAAIADLDPKYRMVVLLKYLEGMTYKEIAETLGWNLGTVASRLSRAHEALARKLKKERP